MDHLPIMTVVEHSQISPAVATTDRQSLQLSFFDIYWLSFREPAHSLFFYEIPVTKTHFTETIVPNLKQSLSLTLKHFHHFAGKLIIFPTTSRAPEIRYVEGDSVTVTFAECNLDFNYVTGNHPRECDKFYHLIPLLGRIEKASDYVTIPVFSVQVTLFPNCGISIGMTSHHSIGDASTMFAFQKAWSSITQSGGSDDTFLANGTLPIFDRLVKYPKLDEIYLSRVELETFNQDYQLATLSGPSDKVRATFILARTVVSGLKKLVSTQLPTLAYVSSFTVVCAYVWNCVADLANNDELLLFGFAIDCRSRMDPPIPAAYFGNCVTPCMNIAKASSLTGKQGFLEAAKLIGENLHKMLTDKDGVVKDIGSVVEDILGNKGISRTIGVAGTPKLKFYDLDFGFGKPKKHEMISIDYNGSISISACRESNEDMEIGVCLSATEMDVFVGNFNSGLESYI